MAGTITLTDPATASRFVLMLPLATLAVDPAGPDSADAAARRAATRSNMLGPAVLDAAHFPVLTLAARQVGGGPDSFLVRTEVGLRGASHSIDVPVRLQVDGPQLVAAGEFTLTHTDLGLRPFAVGLGALRVAETMAIRYRLEARQRGPA